jgi:ligand-binding sensor domain-containing protein
LTKPFIVVIFILFVTLPVYRVLGQQPVLRHYTVNDGLPSSEVHCVMQDHQGYMWFCTDRGICRFDGYTFKVYTTVDGLSDNTIFNAIEDNRNKIWFFGLSGKLSYYLDGKIFRPAVNRFIESKSNSDAIISLATDENGHTWASRESGNRYVEFWDDQVIWHNIPSTRTFIRVVANSFIAGYSNPFVSNRKRDTITFIKNGKTYNILLVYKSPIIDNTRILQLRDSGFLVLRGRNMHTIHGSSAQFAGLLNRSDYLSVYQDSENNLWISYKKSGAVCYKPNPAGGYDSVSVYLPNKSVPRIFEDREGNIWFVTLDDGIYLLTSKAFYSYTIADGLKSNQVRRLSGDDQTLWLGTENGYVQCIDRSGRIIKTLELDNQRNWVQSLYYDSGKNLWIGAGMFGYLLKKNGRLQKCGQGGGNRAFLQYNSHRICSLRSDGLYLAGNDGNFSKLPSDLNLYADGFAIDSHGAIWIGTIGGLWKYNGGKFSFQGSNDQRLAVRVTDVKTDAMDNLWIATVGEGVLVKNKDRMVQISTKDGLVSALCNHLFIDKENIVWVCTGEGLSKINQAAAGKFIIENFTSRNGLLSNEVYDVFRQKNKVFIATGYGLTVLNLQNLATNDKNPVTYITGLNINGKDTIMIKDYLLRYNQNYLGINFTGLLFKNAGRQMYRYKMEGIDNNWVHTKYTSVQYPALAPGEYTFRVAATNDQGDAIGNEASVHLIIGLPFWRKTWFWLIIAISVIIAAGVFFYYRFIQVLQKNKLVEQLNLFKHQALSAQMNPHFIFNSLNSIQNYILENDKASSNKYLTKFASLMRLTLENSIQTIIPIEAELEALRLYLELEKMRFKNKLVYEININPDVPGRNIKIPALLIQPYVENSLKHGITRKQGPGHVIINIDMDQNDLLCSIDDDGVGRSDSAHPVNGYEHRSAGMEITRNRVEIINILYKRNIRINIVDKICEGGRAAGTLVKIALPLN